MSFKKIYRFYKDQLELYPMRTNMITGASITYLSDLIAQKKIEGKKDYDFNRGSRLASFSCFIGAPINTKWTVKIEQIWPGKSIFALTKKVITGQLFWGPVMIFV